MREFQAKKRSKGWLYSKPVLLVLLVVMVFLGHVAWQLYDRYSFTKAERVKAETVLAELQTRKDLLASSVASLDSEAGVEQAVRDKFSVVKPGEFVVNIVDKTASTVPATTTTEKKSWWDKWFD